ncbi:MULTISPECIES: hypothetical protein [Kitasatospora]|uniref:PH domain-containing protein n=1 Tax=Kitasatospora cathayae TaxID=3004092 RepID=A0ABY7QA27_9ACTN|nr:hypothetical protein [Kitasatospora sp. HUAS 3-15]WBP89608.1 hypothetical protein O1G21_29695 [Kitasatospora sp. HUAS 3-15]
MSASTGAVRRRRTFFAVGWAVILLAVVVPPLVVGPAFARSGVLGLPGLVALLGSIGLLEAATARRRSVRMAGGVVRARTWSGEREVDLRDLAVVRAWQAVSRDRLETIVSLTDRSGGWVVLITDDERRQLIADAVRRHGAGYVSPWAEGLLRLTPTRWYAAGGRVLGFVCVMIAPFPVGILLAAAAAQR